MNIETSIIADDFTGAGDSSIYFSQAGFSVFLPLTLNVESFPQQIGILAVNTETRLIGKNEAYRKVREIVERCMDIGVNSFYKKIDSTLRGNIEEEVKAVMDTAGYKAAVICPASPDVGRTVVEGQCLIHNMTINETESSKDHLNPVKSAFIKDLFQTVDSGKMRHIPIREVEKGIDYLREKVNAYLEDGITHIICDADSHWHLKEIAVLFQDSRLLLVGSAGLAKAVSSSYAKTKDRMRESRFADGQILVLSGSKMDVSRRQVVKLSQDRGYQIVPVPVEAILDKDQSAIDRFRSEVENGDKTQPLILVPGEHSRAEASDDIKINSEIIAEFMGDLTARICKMRHISVLITIGGHTTYKTMRKLDAIGVLYQGEVIPGTPYGLLLTKNPSGSLSLVTKSGSFGSEYALVSIVDFIDKGMINRRGFDE